MNVHDLHQNKRGISTAALFKIVEADVISIQILAGEQLKEHSTTRPALLLCVSGEAVFEYENGIKVKLIAGDYVNIEPFTKHWINAKSISNLILIK